MARDSQGLQVLLILFVMVAVVLGVTTYFYAKRADEATKAAAAAAVDRQQIKEEKAAVEKERDVLKTLIGFPERSTEEIKKQFADDMATYGNVPKLPSDTDQPLFDPGTLFYSRLLAGMRKTIQDRTDELIRSRAQWADLEKQFKNREAASAASIDVLVAGYHNLEDQIKKVEGVFSSGQKATQADFDRVRNLLEEIKKAARKETLLADEVKKKAEKSVQEKEIEIQKLKRRLEMEHRQTNTPWGEIMRVSLPIKTVWINLGRADALQPQAQFTVYGAQSTNAATAVEKGLVVVTRIEGEHLAQARILNDRVADPIVAGDKIKVTTPLRSPAP
jgi:archaellum component FlaC